MGFVGEGTQRVETASRLSCLVHSFWIQNHSLSLFCFQW